jgi:hypothetical protein
MSSARIVAGLCLSVFAASVFGFTTAEAQSPLSAPWTTVGSAGTVDESDLGNVRLGTPVAPTVTLLDRGTVHIRYNVVAVGGLLTQTPIGFTMTARFLDQGLSEQVLIRFKEYGLHTGVTTTRLTLDSNSFAPSNSFQVGIAQTNCPPTPADILTFDEHSYFMDVELTKTGRFPIITPFTPMPALGMIKLQAGIVCIT